jgi:hypothetical protein
VRTVYIIGAGASHGQSLSKRYPDAELHQPPLTNRFFDSVLLNAIRYTQAEQDLKDVITHVRRKKLWDDEFGEGRWKTLDLEELFTASAP